MNNPVKIKNLSWGKVETTDGTFKDVKISQSGAEEWNWNETGTHHTPGIQPEDVKDLVDKVDIIILSSGQEERLQVMDKTIEYIESKGVEVERYETKKAVDRYNELVEKNESVGALIHSTC